MKRITDIAALIAEGESQTVEFKASFERETIETLVAFANTQGGRVLVGVADNGRTVGVSIGKETLNQWLGQVKSVTSPALIPDIEVFEIAGRSIVVLSVEEYPVKPVIIPIHQISRSRSSMTGLRSSVPANSSVG